MKTINADDIRLQELPFTFEGREYKLRCTMNTVCDVQLQSGGDLISALSDVSPLQSVLVWLSAMMNNYAESQGWEDFTPYTARALGNKLSPRQVPVADIMDLVRTSLFVPNENGADHDPAEDHEKN